MNMTTMGTDDYLGLLASDEIEKLRNARRGGLVHPVAALALEQPKSQAAINTENAAEQVLRKDENWLKSRYRRLMEIIDFSEASSALGEIRAYGALLETWMNVEPGPSAMGSAASPDFRVDAGDGHVIVEVHSRQLDKAQAEAIREHHIELEERHAAAVKRAQAEGSKGNVITMGELVVTPTGAPDPQKIGDSVLTNTIRRIARIKEEENQIDPSMPFVLWLDLQDPTVWRFPIPDQLFRPLYTERSGGLVGCGPFWFALYGRKGGPLVESDGFRCRSMPMAHEGRFRQKMKSHGGPTRVSAVIYATPQTTILMENPNAPHLIPPRFRCALLRAPFFRLDLSVVEWNCGLVSEDTELQHKAILSAERALKAFNLYNR